MNSRLISAVMKMRSSPVDGEEEDGHIVSDDGDPGQVDVFHVKLHVEEQDQKEEEGAQEEDPVDLGVSGVLAVVAVFSHKDPPVRAGLTQFPCILHISSLLYLE